jgi:hypothetical protein
MYGSPEKTQKLFLPFRAVPGNQIALSMQPRPIA